MNDVAQEIRMAQEAEMAAVDAAFERLLDSGTVSYPAYMADVADLAWRLSTLAEDDGEAAIDRLAERHGVTYLAVERDLITFLSKGA